MDASTPCGNSVSEDNSCESHVYSLSCEKYIEQCTGCCLKESTKSMPLEVLDVSSIIMKDDLMAQEVGNSVGGILHVHDPPGQVPNLNAISDRDETVNPKDIGMSQDFCLSVPLDAKLQKGLRKSVTFPCSEEVQRKMGLSSTAVLGQHPSTIESPSYARSMSLPASFKLVSAMKGGRAQNGISLNEKLHLKWAPEVYDPPATSMSHTVKNHHQRPKAKKKESHKHKKNKGKSTRGSGSEKKNANRRSMGNIPDPTDMRLRAARGGLLLSGYAKANVEVYAVNSQEDKCRTSLLKEGLAKLHLSIAEAS